MFINTRGTRESCCRRRSVPLYYFIFSRNKGQKKKKTRKSTPVSGGGEEGCCRGIPVTFLFSRGENEPFFREEDAVSSSVVLACVKYCDLIKREICRFRPRVCIHSRRGDLTDTFLPRYYYHRDRPYI